MPVEIKIYGDTAHEALNELERFARGVCEPRTNLTAGAVGHAARETRIEPQPPAPMTDDEALRLASSGGKTTRDPQEKIWIHHPESDDVFEGTVADLGADGNCVEVSAEEAKKLLAAKEAKPKTAKKAAAKAKAKAEPEPKDDGEDDETTIDDVKRVVRAFLGTFDDNAEGQKAAQALLNDNFDVKKVSEIDEADFAKAIGVFSAAIEAIGVFSAAIDKRG